MTHKNCLLTALLLAVSPFFLSAQNTIGGVKASVPQKEVERQSAFLDAETERMLGRYDKAIEAYKKFLYDNPDEGAAWYGLARTYVSKGDLVSALDAVGKATEKEPANVWYSVYQSEIYEKTGRVKDAIAVYEGLVKHNPRTSEFYQHLAYLYVSNADPKGALKALDKLEAMEGVHEEVIAKKHLIYVGMGDNRKAAAEYQKLVDAFPTEVPYRRRLADFYERAGDQAAARRTYEDILRMHPDDPVARLALVQPAKGSGEAAALGQLKPL
ncbi:MAG TPA: tetratricopeptide repeat protein, partial [Saprospiraceae bacterium]|nr:tetratricopeptide repeat protein [Saprospiraceae bacterium]